MNIGILGPGAVGGLIGCQLDKAKNNIFCFGTKKSIKQISKKGIYVFSEIYGNKRFFPNVNPKGDVLIDYLFITVKSYYLEKALEDYDKFFNNKTIAISLLNGIGHKQIIKKKFKDKIIVGTIGYVEVVKDKNRNIIHKSQRKPCIEIAPNSKLAQKT